MNDVLSLMRSHRSIRQFKAEPLLDEDLHAAVQAAQMASTSSNIQAYSMLRVTDPEVRGRLVELTGQQRMVAQAAAFFVVLADSRRHRLIAQAHERPFDTHLEGFLLATIDASLFAQNLALAFEALGYGICYIGGLRNHLPDVDEILALPEGVYPLYGMCVGRPAQNPETRPRLPFAAVCFEGQYPTDEEMREQIAKYDDRMRAYYQERSGAPRTWSEGIANLFARPQRTHLAEYYGRKGARLD